MSSSSLYILLTLPGVYLITIALYIMLYIVVLDAYYQFIGYDLFYCFVYISSASFPSSYFLL